MDIMDIKFVDVNSVWTFFQRGLFRKGIVSDSLGRALSELEHDEYDACIDAVWLFLYLFNTVPLHSLKYNSQR